MDRMTQKIHTNMSKYFHLIKLIFYKKNDLKSIPIENFVEAIFYEAAIDHY